MREKPEDSNFDIDKYELKKYVKKISKEKIHPEKEKLYTIYNSNPIARIANRFVEPFTIYFMNKFPSFFKPLIRSLKLIRLNMLSKSYVSMMIFFTIISFFVGTILMSLIFSSFIKGLGLGFLFTVVSFIMFYFYPDSIIGTRNKRIKSELPFAIVHMAGIAGSGAVPIEIFRLLIESKEYPELDKEFKKIINYINLFGYNLSTALKSVADSTPSKDFSELLNGIVSTIESGGNLQDYLDTKAKDSLSTYKLERQKYVESLATYSDIYTAILVASPLFFVITLTIISAIGGKIGGFTVTTIANLGTFIAIPLLNIAFILFLTITQPEL